MRITRTEYLNKLIAFKDKQLIKVVTGIRRCGKSVLMEMYQDWLLQNGVEQDQIIAINFEDMDFEELPEVKNLLSTDWDGAPVRLPERPSCSRKNDLHFSG